MKEICFVVTKYNLSSWSSSANEPLGTVYTKRQRQCCDNSAITLAILFSLKTVESLENRLQTHFGATPLFSMRTVLLSSSQSCRSVDADAWCKWALSVRIIRSPLPMSLAAAFSVAASIPILRLNRSMWISLIRLRKTSTPIKPCSSSVMKARGWKLKYAPETEPETYPRKWKLGKD